MPIRILTHRGLEPSKKAFFSESTKEAFQSQLARGFGLEFDPNYLGDGTVVVTHDVSLARITRGRDVRSLQDITWPEFQGVSMEHGSVVSLHQLLEMLLNAPGELHAIHLKGVYQTEPFLSRLVGVLNSYPELMPRLLLFDVVPQTARWLRHRIPHVLLAPSVAHSFDVARYNSCVGGTLLTVEQTLHNRDLYDGVWLDEWDLQGPNGTFKQFYSPEVFGVFRREGLKIALVTPELHGTSPGLLGGESHPDATPVSRLMARVHAILELKPDAVCTDYPEEIREMVRQ